MFPYLMLPSFPKNEPGDSPPEALYSDNAFVRAIAKRSSNKKKENKKVGNTALEINPGFPCYMS